MRKRPDGTTVYVYKISLMGIVPVQVLLGMSLSTSNITTFNTMV
jgi:hypothetical protein